MHPTYLIVDVGMIVLTPLINDTRSTLRKPREHGGGRASALAYDWKK